MLTEISNYISLILRKIFIEFQVYYDEKLNTHLLIYMFG